MSDVSAGPSSGAQQGSSGPWSGGSPPPILLGAMGAALLIAVTVIAFAIGSGSGDGDLSPASSSASNGGSSVAGDTDGRVRLRVTIEGSGGGEINIAPADISCSETCTNDIVTDTRVRVTADADIGSTFKGWSDACDGTGSCAFYMDRSRELVVTFDKTQAAKQPIADCDNDEIPDAQDSGCDDPPPATPDDTLDAPPPSSGEPGIDCADGIDNDDDGLIDEAQDPGCDFGSEASSATNRYKAPADVPTTTTPAPPPPPPPPPPAAPKRDCSDGIDNDGDGLTDTDQDPGCDKGGTEAE